MSPRPRSSFIASARRPSSLGRARRWLPLATLVLCCPPLLAQQSVRMAYIPFMGEPPVIIARHEGYFLDEGLSVRFKRNAAGKVSLQDLLEGRVDVITIADTPIAYKAFERTDFVILSAITHTDRIAGAVARRDHGIDDPRALAGRRVGLFKGTASDYLLDTYLLAFGLDPAAVTTVDLRPRQLVKALLDGRVDAIFTWQPHVHTALRRLGANAYRLPTDGMKVLDWQLVAMRRYVESNPDVAIKLLRALDRAMSFLHENRQRSMDIFAAESGIARDVVAALWDDFSFGLYLSESLLINLEDQARWALGAGKLHAPAIPNYLDLVHSQALRAVRPDAITLIR